MPGKSEDSAPRIELVPAAPEQEPVIANLLELYSHDFSELYSLEVGSDGRFGYKRLSLCWSDPGRHPFMIEVDGGLVGFALVKRGSGVSKGKTVRDVAEYFVVRAYRGRGIGIKAARQVWGTFPGPWEVRVMQSNRAATIFWRRAIAAFTGQAPHSARIGKDGESWFVFSFESPDPRDP